MNASMCFSRCGKQVRNARSSRSCASSPIFFGIETRTRSARALSVSMYFAPNSAVWSAASAGQIETGSSCAAKLSNTQDRKPMYVPS